MLAARKEVRLHKPAFHLASGVLVRVCDRCGASWKLGPTEAGSQVLGWRPIAELDTFGSIVEAVQIDVLYCPSDVSVVQTAQKTETVKTKSLCYCPTCRVKQQHFEGNDSCFCMKCQGKHPHKGV